MTDYTPSADDWFRSYDERTRCSAEDGSSDLLRAIQRSGQRIEPDKPRRRLTFEEQLALVASGRATIVDMRGIR